MELDRKTVHNPQDLVDWFIRLKRVINKHGIQQEDSYNYDKTNFRIEIGGRLIDYNIRSKNSSLYSKRYRARTYHLR